MAPRKRESHLLFDSLYGSGNKAASYCKMPSKLSFIHESLESAAMSPRIDLSKSPK